MALTAFDFVTSDGGGDTFQARGIGLAEAGRWEGSFQS